MAQEHDWMALTDSLLLKAAYRCIYVKELNPTHRLKWQANAHAFSINRYGGWKMNIRAGLCCILHFGNKTGVVANIKRTARDAN